MKPALGYRWIQPVENWQDFPNGELLKQLENNSIIQRLTLCFGNHLLKIGSLASAMDTTDCRINHQVSLANLSSRTQSTGVIGEIDELPFVQHAIDTAIVSHVLEFSADPHQTLREVHRILMPNGNLILTVFNPLSLILAGKLWPFKSNKSFWNSRFFSIPRIKDWLNLLGFEVVDEHYLCHSTLLGELNPDNNGRFSHLFAKMAPKMGSVCVLTAKKREWPLTPIRPRVRYRTVFQPAVRTASMFDHDKN